MIEHPVIRLSATTAMLEEFGNAKARYPMHKDHPTIYLSHVDGAQGDNVLRGKRKSVPILPRTLRPSLLVSFVYLKAFTHHKGSYVYRDWALDSGAFSAHSMGINIDLDEYIDTCKELNRNDPTLTEIFSLDVIGDWRASLKNVERMWKRGVKAIPCYHVGEPKDVLINLAKDYPKVALGGAVGYGRKEHWAKSCFGLVWPKKLHGFGFGGEKSILNLPWHSVDATNWETTPCKFGIWRSFGRQHLRIRGSSQDLTNEIKYYLDLEAKARQRWKKEMGLLNDLGPTIRLVERGSRGKRSLTGKKVTDA
jgi:hypothetical protein